MAWRRSYFKFECGDCGKNIGGNMMTWHQVNHCTPYKERKAGERLEALKTMPFDVMRFGDIIASGRQEEWKIWADAQNQIQST